MWEVHPRFTGTICGSIDCGTGFCRNAADYGLPFETENAITEDFEFGVINFDNLFSGLLVIFE